MTAESKYESDGRVPYRWQVRVSTLPYRLTKPWGYTRAETGMEAAAMAYVGPHEDDARAAFRAACECPRVLHVEMREFPVPGKFRQPLYFDETPYVSVAIADLRFRLEDHTKGMEER